jgi:hypothetical protein
VLVFGRDYLGAAGGEDEGIAAGAILVDTATWTSCLLDVSGSGAASVAGRVLVYGRGDPAGSGLRAYTGEGRKVFQLLDGEKVSDVQAAGHLAYVLGRVIAVSPRGGVRSAIYVVDARSGKVLTRPAPRGELVDVVSGPS